MTGIEVRGANQLASLAKVMREAGQTGMRRELVKGLRIEVKPLVIAQKREVRSLAGAPQEWKRAAASATRVKISTTAKSAGVRISVGGGQVGKRARHMNRGQWRHPLFADTNHWYVQDVKPGWFDRPAEAASPRLRQRVATVVHNYLAKLRGRV